MTNSIDDSVHNLMLAPGQDNIIRPGHKRVKTFPNSIDSSLGQRSEQTQASLLQALKFVHQRQSVITKLTQQ